MRRFVNGDETILETTGAEVISQGDRLEVRTSDGVFSAVALKRGSAILISYKGRQYRVEERLTRTRSGAAAESGEMRAPMPGQIVDVRNDVGDIVRKGDTVLVLEAMKTQQPFQAPFDGKIVQIFVKKGDQVIDGAVLAAIEPMEPQDV